MSTRIKALTGPGTSAGARGIGGTDLGIMRETPNGDVLCTFGDTFDEYRVGGPGWRSPVALKFAKPSMAQLNAGINFTDAVNNPAKHPDPNYATQSLDYTHNVGFSTVLPTDTLTLGGNTMAMHVMVIGFGGLNDVLWTETHASFDNGERWQHMGPGGRREGGDFGGMFQMLTWEWDPVTDWVYVMTSRGLSRNGGVLLWRVKGYELFDKSKWQSWGYAGNTWAWGNAPTNIMPNGTTVGEMNLRKVQGQWLFTYFETAPVSRIVTRVLADPTSPIGAAAAKTVVSNTSWEFEPFNPNNTVAQLYGGYLIPGSTLAEPHYCVSQWRNPSPDGTGWPYRSLQIKGNPLTAVNPIV